MTAQEIQFVAALFACHSCPQMKERKKEKYVPKHHGKKMTRIVTLFEVK